jgi:hypothetical protein
LHLRDIVYAENTARRQKSQALPGTPPRWL